jgi:hypothetical protein
MAQLEYELAHLTPSLLAASSLYLALLLLQQGKPNAQLEYELAHLTPSLLAASSLYLALLLLQQGKPNGPAGV